MILETFAATYIYVGAIAYLASDNSAPINRALNPTETAASAPPMHPTPDSSIGRISPNVDGSEDTKYLMQAQSEHTSIWATGEERFEDWAK